MNCIDKVKEKLKEYPFLKWKAENSTISVTPEGGFTVWLAEFDGSFIVGYNGWYTTFSKEEEALRCFLFGLCERCRLKVYSRGSREYRWVMESFEDGGWKEYGTTAIIFFPFWRKRKIKYLQNRIA